MPSCASIFISCSAEQEISTPLLILVQVETLSFMLCDLNLEDFFSGFIIFHFIFSIFFFTFLASYLCIFASDGNILMPLTAIGSYQRLSKHFFNLICYTAVSFCCLSLCFRSSRALPLLLSSCVCSLFSFIGSMFLSQNSKCSSRKIGCGSSVSQKCSL